jgi:hypothetical protein
MSQTTSTTVDEVSINIPLPITLHRRMKAEAALQGLSVKEAVIAAVQVWVDNPPVD